jgi:uncharacterized protein YcbK (DUF882 family)
MSWRYFQASEFACHCGCGQNLIDSQFVTELDELRHRYGAPLKVSSGYRCPEHNAKVSETGLTGPHTTGRAADLLVDRGNAYKLLKLALELGFTGIGVQQKGTGRFLHIDNLPNAPGQPRPTLWSY